MREAGKKEGVTEPPPPGYVVTRVLRGMVTTRRAWDHGHDQS